MSATAAQSTSQVSARGLTPLWFGAAVAFLVASVVVGVLVGPIDLGFGRIAAAGRFDDLFLGHAIDDLPNLLGPGEFGNRAGRNGNRLRRRIDDDIRFGEESRLQAAIRVIDRRFEH